MLEWHSVRDSVVLPNFLHFNPVHTFACGQCFRWHQLDNGNWFGVAGGHAAELEWNGRDLTFLHTSEKAFAGYWFDYLDCGRDYGGIKESLAKGDPVMKKAVDFGEGLRLLRQDFSETLVSFIISQNNGIPRIKKIIDSISRHFGREICYDGRLCHAFPAMERLAGLTEEDIRVARAGYREAYILKTARQIAEKQVEYCTLAACDTLEARKEMLKLSGVGPKVADCVLLFSGTKYDVFPVDRWVSRVMAELYMDREAGYDEIVSFARERWGDLMGFAQQYLFFYAREHKIGLS